MGTRVFNKFTFSSAPIKCGQHINYVSYSTYPDIHGMIVFAIQQHPVCASLPNTYNHSCEDDLVAINIRLIAVKAVVLPPGLRQPLLFYILPKPLLRVRLSVSVVDFACGLF